MTDKSATLWASANLTPVSPAPLHPSSPIIVPTLQDQADSLSTMSQPDSYQVGDHANTAPVSSNGQAMLLNQNQVAAANRYEDIVNRDIDLSHPGIEYGPDGGETGAQDGNAAAVGSEGNLQNLYSVAEESNSQHSVSMVNDSTVNTDVSDTLTNHSEPAAPSHDLSHDSSPSGNIHASSSAQPASDLNTQANESHQGRPQTKVKEQSPHEIHNSIDKQPIQTTKGGESPTNATDNPIDIQALVDTITANAAKEDVTQATVPKAAAPAPALASVPAPAPAPAPGTSSNSLPPRPPIPQQSTQSYVPLEDARAYQPGFAPAIPATLPSSISLVPSAAYPGGAPGTISNSHGALPPPPSTSLNTAPVSQFTLYPSFPGHLPPPSITSQQWESFLQDERKYVSEARWDRFPEGSRLFIGNLSSERASKKEVFDIFAPYGNLAQISLKQAYGFVQYHTAAEGQAALDNLQGIDIKGRKVHLEISRPQKKEGNGDKQRGNKRDRKDSDRYDGGRGRRDDYRPTRQPSPRRSGHRQQNSYSTDRSYHDGYNSRHGRSRSPSHHGRRDSGGYRQRSPSPYRNFKSEAELDIPRRYGANVPDVQFLLLHEVSRDFISWVEGAFVAAGLRVEVMFLNPRFPQNAVIQRQVVEGVHAVTELTFQAQQTSKISLQVFDRSAGRDNVRFDQYQDLDPNIAAQLVVRAKGALPTTPPYGGHPTYNNYPAYNSQPAYGGYPSYATSYPQPTQPSHMPPPYPNQPYPPTNAPASSRDNINTLQQILGNIHNPQPTSAHGMPPHPSAPADMNAYIPGYGINQHPPPHGVPAHGARPASSGESAQHVQNIMAQLSRYRQ